MSLVIGIDLDNTIIDYGDLFYQVAVVERLITDSAHSVAKTDVREQVRALADGEAKWQLVQSIVYSQELVRAQLFEGVTEFLNHCREREVGVNIISHKTEFPNSAEVPAVNLRQAALDWLEQRGVVEPAAGFLVPRQHVSFHATRQEKLASIREQQCDYFIDDLPQVLAAPSFPATTKRILFSPDRNDGPHDFISCTCWREIDKVIFSEA